MQMYVRFSICFTSYIGELGLNQANLIFAIGNWNAHHKTRQKIDLKFCLWAKI